MYRYIFASVAWIETVSSTAVLPLLPIAMFVYMLLVRSCHTFISVRTEWAASEIAQKIFFYLCLLLYLCFRLTIPTWKILLQLERLDLM